MELAVGLLSGHGPSPRDRAEGSLDKPGQVRGGCLVTQGSFWFSLLPSLAVTGLLPPLNTGHSCCCPIIMLTPAVEGVLLSSVTAWCSWPHLL